jgi:hypothetical protein
MKPKLILDLDDTLVNFVDNWLSWIHKEGYSTRRYIPSEVEYYTWFIDKFGPNCRDFFLNDPIDCYTNKLVPYRGALSFYKFCERHFDVEIVTHACKVETEIAKTNFVKHYFGKNVKIRFFSVLEEKVNYIGGSILIDDYPFHVIKHTEINKMPGIIFDYNGRNGWSKLENYINILRDVKSLDLIKYATTYKELKLFLGEHI